MAVLNKRSLLVSIIIAAAILGIWMLQGRELPSATEAPLAMAPQDELCTTHQLPIGHCFFCNPELREPGRLWCEEHERYEDRCFIYNQNHLACITPLAGGVVKSVSADLGDIVSKDQVLVEIFSPDIAKAKSDYLSALSNNALKELVFKREKELVDKKISSRQEYEQALAEYQVAKNTTMMMHQQLLNYGLTEKQIRGIVDVDNHSSSSHLSILAPFSGTLIERNAVIGEVVKPGDVLFTLADISTMWLEITVPEDRLSPLKVGGLVEATFDALPEVNVRGRLIWLASSIDEQSRMMKAHASVVNPNSFLKHGMFGKVRILPEHTVNGLRVPADTIHYFNGKAFVFVKLSNDLYEIRRVSLGGKENNHVEVVEGVTPNTEVVVAHSFTLKSEFLKSRLGAGVCMNSYRKNFLC